MFNRIEKINDLLSELKSEISSLICDSVVNTIQVMFNEKIEVVSEDRAGKSQDTIVTAVELKQDIFKANMLFTFDYDLIYVLIAKVYPDEILNDREAFEDTACEITNIVCNRVKALVNSFGMNLEMDLPYVNRDGKIVPIDAKMLSLHFSLRDNNMHVDFGYNKSRAA